MRINSSLTLVLMLSLSGSTVVQAQSTQGTAPSGSMGSPGNSMGRSGATPNLTNPPTGPSLNQVPQDTIRTSPSTSQNTLGSPDQNLQNQRFEQEQEIQRMRQDQQRIQDQQRQQDQQRMEQQRTQ